MSVREKPACFLRRRTPRPTRAFFDVPHEIVHVEERVRRGLFPQARRGIIVFVGKIEELEGRFGAVLVGGSSAELFPPAVEECILTEVLPLMPKTADEPWLGVTVRLTHPSSGRYQYDFLVKTAEEQQRLRKVLTAHVTKRISKILFLPF
jgi:hypothetical protein